MTRGFPSFSPFNTCFCMRPPLATALLSSPAISQSTQGHLCHSGAGLGQAVRGSPVTRYPSKSLPSGAHIRVLYHGKFPRAADRKYCPVAYAFNCEIFQHGTEGKVMNVTHRLPLNRTVLLPRSTPQHQKGPQGGRKNSSVFWWRTRPLHAWNTFWRVQCRHVDLWRVLRASSDCCTCVLSVY